MKKSLLLILPLTIAALSLGGCGDKATSEKKAADEKQADSLEDKAKAVKDDAAAKAHEEKAAGEAKADELKNEAKEKREEKKNE